MTAVAIIADLAAAGAGCRGTSVSPAEPVDASVSHDGPLDAQRTDAGDRPLCTAAEWTPTEARQCTGGWCWDLPRPQGNTLNAVWSLAPNDVWAGGDAGTLLHWDGSNWSRVDAGTDADVMSIWASSSADVWIVSIPRGIETVDPDRLRHWDGTAWTAVTLPDDGYPSGHRPTTVWGTGRDDVWVGLPGRVVHFDGRQWRYDVPSASGEVVLGFSGHRNDVWMLQAGGTASHWDGTSWAPVRPDGSTSGWTGYGGLWANAGDDAWVTPELHWDGASWTRRPLAHDASSGWGWSMWGSGAADVWALGVSSAHPTEWWHWNGADWSLVPRGSVLLPLAVSGSGSNDAWAVGNTGMLAHWDGTRWQTPPSTTLAPYGPLSALSGTSDHDVWAVGGIGLLGGSGVVLHWDGASWRRTCTRDVWADVWATSPADAWAVGGDGAVSHWDGSAWSAVERPTTDALRAVWAAGPNDVWAAGDSAQGASPPFFHWDGQAWTRALALDVVDADVSYAVSTLWGISPDDAWAVAYATVHAGGAPLGYTDVFHWDGHRWSRPAGLVHDGTMRVGGGVWGSSPDDVWFGGDGLYHWDGTTLTPWPPPAGTPAVHNVYALWGSSSNDVWGIAAGDWMIHWDGAAWSRVPTGASAGFTALWGDGRGRYWAAGLTGVVMRYGP